MLRVLSEHSGWLILPVHKSEKVGGYSPPAPHSTALDKDWTGMEWNDGMIRNSKITE